MYNEHYIYLNFDICLYTNYTRLVSMHQPKSFVHTVWGRRDTIRFNPKFMTTQHINCLKTNIIRKCVCIVLPQRYHYTDHSKGNS